MTDPSFAELQTIEYELMEDLEIKEGTFHRVTKKDLCRLIKGAEVVGHNM